MQVTLHSATSASASGVPAVAGSVVAHVPSSRVEAQSLLSSIDKTACLQIGIAPPVYVACKRLLMTSACMKPHRCLGIDAACRCGAPLPSSRGSCRGGGGGVVVGHEGCGPAWGTSMRVCPFHSFVRRVACVSVWAALVPFELAANDADECTQMRPCRNHLRLCQPALIGSFERSWMHVVRRRFGSIVCVKVGSFARMATDHHRGFSRDVHTPSRRACAISEAMGASVHI